ncbi:hypothetical protein CFSAN001628_018424 [Clostridium botulinum CFSAN001628]|uniref:Uncharacterized protein n=1 Tax=Clostridium botulinum (strain Langeland / NCTC 10281 / Type F) TaxID=441772 RepID=A7GC98_CLOBL|nr:hypothetical protein CLI_1142 [Clostridium botulinum F str. Langeland]ADF98872.1 hypothetical protein CBF_1113 [Clostridium botulinum F str. 230613]EKX78594.1 hypothetical protein CFSAN001628_018424 [Clostridium botulinum CFSAN001628]
MNISKIFQNKLLNFTAYMLLYCSIFLCENPNLSEYNTDLSRDEISEAL